MKSAFITKQKKLKKQNNRRKLSSDTFNKDKNLDNSYNYYDNNGMENEAGGYDEDAQADNNVKSSKCRVSSIHYAVY